MSLPRQQALAAATEFPGVGRAFTWLALSENAILSQWAVGLVGKPAVQRFAHLLCELSFRLGADNAGKHVFDMPLTNGIIGDVLGIRPMQSIALSSILSPPLGER